MKLIFSSLRFSRFSKSFLWVMLLLRSKSKIAFSLKCLCILNAICLFSCTFNEQKWIHDNDCSFNARKSSVLSFNFIEKQYTPNSSCKSNLLKFSEHLYPCYTSSKSARLNFLHSNLFSSIDYLNSLVSNDIQNYLFLGSPYLPYFIN